MKRKRHFPKERQHWLTVEAETKSGAKQTIRVYTEGDEIELVGPNLEKHSCPKNRRELEGVKLEIATYFHVTIITITNESARPST